MSACRGRCHAAALLGYVCVALAFAWPLPLHLASALPGTIGGDTGVYVWNLWLFRHEIVANHHFPFLTVEILSLTPPTALTHHNYTTLANVLAFPLLPVLGTVATFNVLVMTAGVVSAYAMFLFARRAVGDGGAAWVAGLLFGFSPFMSARATEHFSLVQTAPLVMFALMFDRLQTGATTRVAAAMGAAVALAFLSDPYYAVYCLLMGGFAIGYHAVVIRPATAAGPTPWHAVLNVALVCLAGLIGGIILRGGRFELLGMRVSMTRLYTPVLVFMVILLVRVWVSLRGRVGWVWPSSLLPMRVVLASAVACVALLSPVLGAAGMRIGERQWISPKVLWRSSPPGLDLLALFVPNPMHPWFGPLFHDGLQGMPNGFVENVGSIPWTAIAVLVIGVACTRQALPRYWLAFTAGFALLALGPFIQVAGQNTYVPTPWALLRYVPVIGAARMPTRITALVMFGIAMMLAFALRDLRTRSARPALLAAAVAAVLAFEMLPAPRGLQSAAIPSVFRTIAADPRPVRVLNLPFGLRDGLSSHGNVRAAAQFYQTVHEKQLLGGYVSRLPLRAVEYYRSRRVTRALLDLSEGRTLSDERRIALITRAHEIRSELNIGYVVVDTGRASDELVEFARAAFDLSLVASDGHYVLYRTPLASPPPPAGSHR
jgi:hypothetical protein